MSSLLAVTERLLIDSAIGGNAPFAGKHKAGHGLMTLSGFMLATGLGFTVYASYLWLGAHYPPDEAAALAGGLALFLALFSALAANVCLEYRRFRLKKFKAEASKVMTTVLEILGEELDGPVRENPKTAMLLASLAGFAAGEKLL